MSGFAGFPGRDGHAMARLPPENFRDFTFVNPAMLHLSMNPDYFRGTVVEDAAAALLRERSAKPGTSGRKARNGPRPAA